MLDMAFDEGVESHRRLLNLGSRLEAEAVLAAKVGLGSLDLVIDVPEGLSFETDLLVLREDSVARIRVARIRVARIRVARIRVARIRVARIRVARIRVARIRVASFLSFRARRLSRP